MEYTIIEPDFFKDFACIAGACRYSCCDYPWRVFVDKKTYKTYKNLRQPKELAERFQSSDLFKNPNSKGNSDYGVFRLKASLDKPGKTPCAFLNEKGLCDIQLVLGGDKLCRTCKMYPRKVHMYADNILEKNFAPDCEAVLELLYKHPEPIRFINYSEEIAHNAFNSMMVSIELNKEQRYYANYLGLKAVCFAILQDREYSFEDRMVHLAIFCKKLDELTDENKDADIDAFCDEFVDLLVHRSFDDLAKEKPNYQIQLLFANHLYSSFSDGIIADTEKVEAINKNIASNESPKKLEELYTHYIENFNAFMADKQYFLENLMVMVFHCALMPLSQESAMESFYTFAANFIMLRYLIAGYMGNRKEISQDELIDLCAYLQREALHNSKKNQTIMEFLKINNMDNLAYIIMLLKS